MNSNSKKNDDKTHLWELAESASRHKTLVEWALMEPFFYYLAHRLCSPEQLDTLIKHMPDRNYVFLVVPDEKEEVIH